MAQIQQPSRRPTQLDAINSALGIASTVFGIKNAIDKQSLLAQQTESASIDLAEKKQRAQGILTPLAKQQLQTQGFQEIDPSEIGKLGPQQKQKLNIVEFKQPGAKEGEMQSVFFAKVPKGLTPKPISEIEKKKALADIGYKKAQASKAMAEAERVKTGAPLPKEVRQEQKFLARQFQTANMPQLTQQLSKIDDFLIKDLGIKNGLNERDPKVDIPGFGLSSFLPGQALSKKGKAFRQLIQGLENQVLKMRSGGAVTPQEAERLIKEIKGAGTDRELLAGLRTFKDTINSAIQNTFAGVSEEGMMAYTKRGGINPNIPLFARPYLELTGREDTPIAKGSNEQEGNLLPSLSIIRKINQETEKTGANF